VDTFLLFEPERLDDTFKQIGFRDLGTNVEVAVVMGALHLSVFEDFERGGRKFPVLFEAIGETRNADEITFGEQVRRLLLEDRKTPWEQRGEAALEFIEQD